MRPADLPADPAADRRPPARAARGYPVPGAGPGRAGTQGRVRRPVRGAAGQGLRPGARRRRRPRAHRRAEAGEAAQAHHRGGGRPAGGEGVRQTAPDGLRRDRARPRRRSGTGRLRRPGPRRPRPRADVLRAPGLPVRRPVVRGARAAVVLLQLPVRRLRALLGPGHPQGGRPRPGRPRPVAVAGGRRGRPLVGRPQQGVLHPAPRGPRRRPRLPDGHPLGGAAGTGPQGGAVRAGRDRGPGLLHQPLRPLPPVLHGLRGRRLLPSAPPPRGRVGQQPGALRGLHARRRLLGLPRRPAQTRVAGGDAEWPVDRRDRRHGHRGVRRVPAHPRAHRARAHDRRPGAQGDRRAAGVPARRRPRLPLAGPGRRHPGRR